MKKKLLLLLLAIFAIGGGRLWALPFETGKWYNLTIKGTFNIYADLEGGTAIKSKATKETAENQKYFQWTFIGDDENGYAIKNRKTEKYISYGNTVSPEDNTNATLADNADDLGAKFDIKEKNGSWFICIHGTTNNTYMNQRSENLSTWPSEWAYGDGGSIITFVESVDMGSATYVNNLLQTTKDKVAEMSALPVLFSQSDVATASTSLNAISVPESATEEDYINLVGTISNIFDSFCRTAENKKFNLKSKTSNKIIKVGASYIDALSADVTAHGVVTLEYASDGLFYIKGSYLNRYINESRGDRNPNNTTSSKTATFRFGHNNGNDENVAYIENYPSNQTYRCIHTNGNYTGALCCWTSTSDASQWLVSSITDEQYNVLALVASGADLLGGEEVIGKPVHSSEYSNLQGLVNTAQNSINSGNYDVDTESITNAANSVKNVLYLPNGYYYFKGMETSRLPYLYNDDSEENKTKHTGSVGVTNNFVWKVTRSNDGTSISVVNGQGTPVKIKEGNTYPTLHFGAYNGKDGIYFTEALNLPRPEDNTTIVTWAWGGANANDNRWTFEPADINVFSVKISGPEGTFVEYDGQKAANNGFFNATSIEENELTIPNVEGMEKTVNIDNTNKIVTISYSVDIVGEEWLIYNTNANKYVTANTCSSSNMADAAVFVKVNADAVIYNETEYTSFYIANRENGFLKVADGKNLQSNGASKFTYTTSSSDAEKFIYVGNDIIPVSSIGTTDSQGQISWNWFGGASNTNPMGLYGANDGNSAWEFRMPVPENGMFLRMKSAYNGSYISIPANHANGTSLVMNAEANNDNIFYYNGQKMLSYASGYYMNENNHALLGYSGSYIISASKHGTEGKYSIKPNNRNYYYAGEAGSSINNWEGGNHERCDWVIEPVTSLPVTIWQGAKGNMGTMNLPVAVKLPKNVCAYTLTTLNGKSIELTKTYDYGAVVPANVPVLLYTTEEIAEKQGKVYNMTITSEAGADAGTNLFAGTTAKIASPAGYNYVLDADADNNNVFLKTTSATINAWKAYIHTTEELNVKAMSITLGEETAIGTINVDNSSKSRVYDLTGRRVNNAAKGIFIINGKKVIK